MSQNVLKFDLKKSRMCSIIIDQSDPVWYQKRHLWHGHVLIATRTCETYVLGNGQIVFVTTPPDTIIARISAKLTV